MFAAGWLCAVAMLWIFSRLVKASLRWEHEDKVRRNLRTYR